MLQCSWVINLSQAWNIGKYQQDSQLPLFMGGWRLISAMLPRKVNSQRGWGRAVEVECAFSAWASWGPITSKEQKIRQSWASSGGTKLSLKHSGQFILHLCHLYTSHITGLQCWNFYKVGPGGRWSLRVLSLERIKLVPPGRTRLTPLHS